jgi:peptidoglycan/LPS O-acetylase OafA/YrhL
MLLLAFPAFALMLPIAWLGWLWIEKPVMKMRRPYLVAPAAPPDGAETANASAPSDIR